MSSKRYRIIVILGELQRITSARLKVTGNGEVDRRANRKFVKNSEFENQILFYLLHFLLFISFNYSRIIRQSVSYNGLSMERMKTPLQLVTIHFRVGKCLVIGLGYSVPFSTEVKK
jgi:hypothetical protein